MPEPLYYPEGTTCCGDSVEDDTVEAVSTTCECVNPIYHGLTDPTTDALVPALPAKWAIYNWLNADNTIKVTLWWNPDLGAWS